jgi:oligopeptide transport system substrate-binding protein
MRAALVRPRPVSVDMVAVENKIKAGELDINNAFDGTRRAELDKQFPGWPRTVPALWTTYWTFNTAAAPFDDMRVRKALSMALDREFIVKSVLTPGFEPAYSFVPPGVNNYAGARPAVSWAKTPRPARLEEARRLLTEAGFGPARPLTFEFIHRSTDDNPKAAPVAQANWAEIAPWVKPVIVKQDTKVLYARLRQSDYEVSDAAWVADFDDPINFLYLLQSETGQQNYGDYANGEYDALLARSNAEPDLAKRADLFRQAESVMLEEYPVTPMWFAVSKNLVDPTLTGWVDNAKNQHRSRFLCRKIVQP